MKLKERSCKYCKQRYVPERAGQIICSNIDCAVGWTEKLSSKRSQMVAKADRKVTRERKEKLKSRSDWLDDLQKVFNAYIRERDYYEPCISCGTTNPDIQYCAGHYRTRGSSPHLRFNELNVNKQCNKRCNLELSGNIVNYRIGLIKKIGLEAVERIESDNNPAHYSIDDIKSMIVKYRDMKNNLVKLRESA